MSGLLSGFSIVASLRLISWKMHAIKQDGFDRQPVFLGVHTDGVVGCRLDVNVDAVFEKAKLLQPLGGLERARGQCWKAIEGGFAISVEAEMLAVGHLAGLVAVERDGRPREVKRAT